MSAISVLNYAGEPVEVAAFECGVPGLAIHAALTSTGFCLTHVASGLLVGWWPEGSPEQVLGCAQAAASLVDWTSAKTADIAIGAVRAAVLEHGGWVGRKGNDGRVWLAIEDGELTEITCAGAS